MFNKYYQDELAYLRQLGKEFSEAYPALGPMLADRGADPDVERLLEGVAFLTGRIRQKLDDELPELMLAIAGLLFPHLTRPLPGAAILELELLPNVLRERKIVPQGSEFSSIQVDGTPCRFTSCWTFHRFKRTRVSGLTPKFTNSYDFIISPFKLRCVSTFYSIQYNCNFVKH